VSEHTETKPTPDAIELETLRRVNSELVQKSQTRKAKITELEAQVAELQGKVATSDATIHDLAVTAPLKAMAASISIDPDFFLEQFGKSYKVEMVEGKLTLRTTDGQSVTNDGKVVPFERQSLIDLLTSGDGTQAKVYRSIVIGTLASGANGSSGEQGSRHTSSAHKPKPSFGIGVR